MVGGWWWESDWGQEEAAADGRRPHAVAVTRERPPAVACRCLSCQRICHQQEEKTRLVLVARGAPDEPLLVIHSPSPPYPVAADVGELKSLDDGGNARRQLLNRLHGCVVAPHLQHRDGCRVLMFCCSVVQLLCIHQQNPRTHRSVAAPTAAPELTRLHFFKSISQARQGDH